MNDMTTYLALDMIGKIMTGETIDHKQSRMRLQACFLLLSLGRGLPPIACKSL
jgi:hypothetical protein